MECISNLGILPVRYITNEGSVNLCDEANQNFEPQVVQNPYYGGEPNTDTNPNGIGRPCSFMNDTEIISTIKNDYYAT